MIPARLVPLSLALAFAPLAASAQEIVEPTPVIGEVQAPVLVSKVAPEYPDAARRTYRAGRVILRIVVARDGTVADSEVLQSAGPDLDDAARRAVARWRYQPGTLRGEPIAVYYTVSVDFSIDLEGRVMDVEDGRVSVVFPTGAPPLKLPADAELQRTPPGHPEGARTTLGKIELDRRARGADRPTYEGRLVSGAAPVVGDVVLIVLGEGPTLP